MRFGGKIVIGLAVCCASSVSCISNRTLGSDIVYYSDKPRTFFERFVRDSEEAGIVWWQGGNIEGRRNKGKQQDALFDEFTSAPLHDCSDRKYLCVYGTYRVFAVPREGLTAQSTYSAGGAFLRVEKCLRGSAVRCLQALISSDCRQQVEPDRCVERPSAVDSGSERGRIGYFIFDQNIGVTAYGSVTEPATTLETQMGVARELLLRSKKGLLANGIPTPFR